MRFCYLDSRDGNFLFFLINVTSFVCRISLYYDLIFIVDLEYYY